MKFPNKNLKAILILACFALANLSQLRMDSEDSNSSDTTSENPSKNKFKGKVSFEKEGRGILITSGKDRQNDKLLKSVSEKITADTYLIDYRLMRSCEFSVKFTGEKNKNLKIGFSPRSLENKSKNEKFDIKLEILDYQAFFPKVEKNEEAVKNQIKKDCNARKAKVNSLKQQLLDKFAEYKTNIDKNRKVNLKLTSTKKDTQGFDSGIEDINGQISAINSLQKSYEDQKKNLQLLKKGSQKLLRKEREELRVIHDKNEDINNKLKENSILLRKLADKENDLKKNYEGYVLEQKNIENEIISLSKKISDTDQQISSLARNKLSDEYELQFAQSTQKEIKNLIEEIKVQTEKFRKSKAASQKKSNQLVRSKELIEKSIKNNKEKIRNIDDQINELIIKKSKLEEDVKEQYNTIKSKDDEISAIEIENQQISSNIKRLEDKLKASKNSLENIQEKHSYLSQHQKKFKNKLNNLNNTRHNITIQLQNAEKKKSIISKKIKANNGLIEKNSNETNNLNNIKFSFEKKIADNGIELKEKDQNVKNLEAEIRNYDNDIENIDKTISSFKENKQNLQKILFELNKKLNPYNEEAKKLAKEHNQVEDRLSKERKDIRTAISELRKNIPSIRSITEIIEDEFSYADEEFDDRKFAKLVQKIIA